MPAWPRVTVANQLFTVTEQAEGRGRVQVTKGARERGSQDPAPWPRPPAPRLTCVLPS